jgi:hypothetical protein
MDFGVKLRFRLLFLLFLALMSATVLADRPTPASPPATDDVARLRCDYTLKVDRTLANGIPERANLEKTNQLYEFDFSSKKLWRHRVLYPIKVSDSEIDFTIGELKYKYDRGTMQLKASSYVSTPGGTSNVTVDGSCKNEVIGVFSPTATP